MLIGGEGGKGGRGRGWLFEEAWFACESAWAVCVPETAGVLCE